MRKILAVYLFFPLIFSSCMTMADYDFSSVDSAVSGGDFSLACQVLENNSYRIYSNFDEVLEFLDRGILLHFAQRYSESNEALSQAEKLIEKYRAKSISQSVGSVLINDTVTDYPGEDFEDIYTNIFMCLNYIGLGDAEGAMVEIRRFDNKMKTIGSRYQAARENLEKQIETDTSQIKTEAVKFHNSALARYLSMLLYRSQNQSDEAVIDLNNIKAAFSMQPSVYNFPMPENLRDETSVPLKKARINFIAFHGLSPVKVEQVTRLPLPDFYYKLSLPVMQSRASSITAIKVTAVNKSDGSVYKGTLSKIESIDNIAKDTFSDRYDAVVMKTVFRALAKATTGTVLKMQGENKDSTLGALENLFGIIVQVSTEFTERADVRSSRYFPGCASAGALELPPGTYDLRLDFCNYSGKAVGTKTVQDFSARAGNALNLMEAACLR